ncbi:MAG: TIGR04282 family arsenosugar biosynthesis glycosyltransferase [Candidatus Omnitrophica bacterium]|nr:TIGR04282 family arsenosugar biosynthesis glycosyltransferase [Candidatus Omnitrophota bacterium]
MNKTHFIIFAREPKPGKVKTRLEKDLIQHYISKQMCNQHKAKRCARQAVLEIYTRLIEDVLGLVQSVPADEKALYYHGHPKAMPVLRRLGGAYQFRRQTGPDLGTRMGHAFQRAFQNGAQRVVVIGSDCIALRARDVRQAFAMLKRQECVLGPSQDGGYYLIGLNRNIEELFSGIPWGSGKVFHQTLKKLERLKITPAVLRVFFDVDHLQDLEKIHAQKHAFGQTRTFQSLKKFLIT